MFFISFLFIFTNFLGSGHSYPTPSHSSIHESKMCLTIHFRPFLWCSAPSLGLPPHPGTENTFLGTCFTRLVIPPPVPPSNMPQNLSERPEHAHLGRFSNSNLFMPCHLAPLWTSRSWHETDEWGENSPLIHPFSWLGQCASHTPSHPSGCTSHTAPSQPGCPDLGVKWTNEGGNSPSFVPCLA